MTAVVYDETWKRRQWPRALSEALGRSHDWIAIPPSCTLSNVMELSARLPTQGDVAVIGGGGVIDAAKLACVAQEIPLERYIARGRAGIAAIPTPTNSRLSVIPTTLGTGSEANGKAIVDVAPGRRRLIVGSRLAPHHHSHDPEVYETLPERAVVHGVLEIFFRAAALLSTSVSASDDSEVATLAHAAAALCWNVAAANHPSTDANLMMSAANLSVATHQVRVASNSLMWVWPLWYLSNELSVSAGVSKMEATIALFPHVIADLGEFGYGDPSVTHQLKRLLGCPPVEFVEAVSGGLDQRVLHRLRSVEPEAVARRAFSHWAGPALPLVGVSIKRLEDLYREAVSRDA